MDKTLIFVSAWITLFCTSSFAGELFDDFIQDQLADDVWWVKTTGNATAEIKDGELTLSTFDTEDSIFLFYRDPIPPGQPVTVELRINLKTNADDGWFGFLKDFPGDSHVNTLINPLKGATMFFVPGGGVTFRPKKEDYTTGPTISFTADKFYTYKFELTQKKSFLWFDEDEVLESDRMDNVYTNRVFYITPDGFDSHYGPASYVLDWIRLSGPTIPDRIIAVDALDKLAGIWGGIKSVR